MPSFISAQKRHVAENIRFKQDRLLSSPSPSTISDFDERYRLFKRKYRTWKTINESIAANGYVEEGEIVKALFLGCNTNHNLSTRSGFKDWAAPDPTARPRPVTNPTATTRIRQPETGDLSRKETDVSPAAYSPGAKLAVARGILALKILKDTGEQFRLWPKMYWTPKDKAEGVVTKEMEEKCKKLKMAACKQAMRLGAAEANKLKDGSGDNNFNGKTNPQELAQIAIAKIACLVDCAQRAINDSYDFIKNHTNKDQDFNPLRMVLTAIPLRKEIHLGRRKDSKLTTMAWYGRQPKPQPAVSKAHGQWVFNHQVKKASRLSQEYKIDEAAEKKRKVRWGFFDYHEDDRYEKFPDLLEPAKEKVATKSKAKKVTPPVDKKSKDGTKTTSNSAPTKTPNIKSNTTKTEEPTKVARSRPKIKNNTIKTEELANVDKPAPKPKKRIIEEVEEDTKYSYPKPTKRQRAMLERKSMD